MATAGNGVTITTSGVSGGSTTLFIAATDGGPCQSIFISNRSGSAGNILINIPGLHAASDWAGIAPGQSVPFAFGLNVNGISQVNIKTDTGTATADFGVMKKC